ncbi:DUF305 domain-containing protein [Nocardia sp. NPDC052566]|uniref:DUF305 domain-containing protein n=1 Tax=Nocardia sp. NPDC052566 TaxID=3364330 RepID=UPI0037C8A058
MFITPARIKAVAIAGAAAAALFTAGCSNDKDGTMPGMNHSASSSAASPSAAPAARTDFNDADVTFLQQMYPHHAQAVEMAKLVPSRSQNPRLLALATAVEQAQTPEMQQITTLLQSFGKPAPAAAGHGGHAMPGMMSGEQMSALQAATGAEFDRQWLTLMIEHHTGAIDMAKTELAGGVNAESKALATNVIADQQKEIDTMRGMLAQS